MLIGRQMKKYMCATFILFLTAFLFGIAAITCGLLTMALSPTVDAFLNTFVGVFMLYMANEYYEEWKKDQQR